jgi:hypothetical protein
MEYIERFAQIEEGRVRNEEHVGHLVNDIIVSYDDGCSSSMPSYTLSAESCYSFIKESLKMFDVSDMTDIKGKHAIVLYRKGDDKPFGIRAFRQLNQDAIIFKRMFGTSNEKDSD